MKPTTLGWLIFLVALYYISKYPTGKRIIHYVLLLVLVVLVAGNAARIQKIMMREGGTTE